MRLPGGSAGGQRRGPHIVLASDGREAEQDSKPTSGLAGPSLAGPAGAPASGEDAALPGGTASPESRELLAPATSQ